MPSLHTYRCIHVQPVLACPMIPMSFLSQFFDCLLANFFVGEMQMPKPFFPFINAPFYVCESLRGGTNGGYREGGSEGETEAVDKRSNVWVRKNGERLRRRNAARLASVFLVKAGPRSCSCVTEACFGEGQSSNTERVCCSLCITCCGNINEQVLFAFSKN